MPTSWLDSEFIEDCLRFRVSLMSVVIWLLKFDRLFSINEGDIPINGAREVLAPANSALGEIMAWESINLRSLEVLCLLTDWSPLETEFLGESVWEDGWFCIWMVGLILQSDMVKIGLLSFLSSQLSLRDSRLTTILPFRMSLLALERCAVVMITCWSICS
jgi:hypothetical protein